MTNTNLNKDGLYQKYGTAAATPTAGGEYSFEGPLHQFEWKITLADLATGSTIIGDVVQLPKNARIQEVRVITHTAATGAGAVLNVGLIRSDRTTTYDADGLIAALPLASMDSAGESTILNVGSTYVGALVGTTLANTGLLVADYDTAAFTAGVIYVRVLYYVV